MTTRKKTVTKTPITMKERMEPYVDFADKMFLAGVGVFAATKSAVDSGLAELVKEGKTTRDEYKDTFSEFRGDIADQADSMTSKAREVYEENSPVDLKALRGRVDEFTEKFTDRALGFFPVATEREVKELDKKLDRILVQVGK